MLSRFLLTLCQGWEFAHRFSEQITRFLPKNEQFDQKNERFTHSLIFCERPERFAHSRSFPLQPERFPHGRTFVLSESLTVAHLIWAKWVNERIPSPALCKFPFERVKILKSLKYEKAKIGSYEYLRYPVYVILCPIAIITAGILSTWYSVLQLLLPQVFCPHGTLSHSAAQPVTKKLNCFLLAPKLSKLSITDHIMAVVCT